MFASRARGVHPPALSRRGRVSQADSLVRPRRRRDLRMAWPARLDMRWRNPCLRDRLRLFGWKVRFISALDRPEARRVKRHEDRLMLRASRARRKPRKNPREVCQLELAGRAQVTSTPDRLYSQFSGHESGDAPSVHRSSAPAETAVGCAVLCTRCAAVHTCGSRCGEQLIEGLRAGD